MKILVIGEMRARTNWFMDTLSSHLGIKNVGSPYGILHNEATDVDKWINTIGRITNVIHRNEKFLAKVETTEMFLNDQYISLEHFCPEKYDNIYTIKRDNLTDTFCSLYIVELLNKWQHRVGDTSAPVDTTTIDPAKNAELLKTVRVIRETYNRSIEYLENLFIPYEELEYNKIGDWLEQNAKSGYSDLISPNYNYKEIFSNYADIETFLGAV
jgi:hypothetical protein